MTGRITLRPISANLTRDTEALWGKMDPFCEIRLGTGKNQKIFTTKVHDNGGKTPKWSDVFTSEYRGQMNGRVKVMDKDMTGNDNVGSGNFSLKGLMNRGEQKVQVPIQYKNKPAGTVYLMVTITTDQRN